MFDIEHFIDPYKKDKAWYLDAARQAFHDAIHGDGYSEYYSDKKKYRDIKDYALGKVDPSIYKEEWGIDPNQRESLLRVNFKHLSIYPQYRARALKRLSDAKLVGVANPVDPMAMDELEREFKQKKIDLLMKDWLGEDTAQYVGIETEMGDPQDLEELEIMKTFQPRHWAGIEMGLINKLIHTRSKGDEVFDDFDREHYDYGKAFIKIERRGDDIRYRCCNLKNIIHGYSEGKDFRNVPYIGEVTLKTVEQIRKEAGDEISADDYKKLEKLSRSNQGHSTRYANNQRRRGYDRRDKFIEVLDLEFYGYMGFVFESRKDSFGNRIVRPYSFDESTWRGKNDYTKGEVRVVHKVKWVVNTNICYDSGITRDVDRFSSHCDYSFIGYAAEYDDGMVSARGEQVMPVVDQIQLTWQKINQAINEAGPPGYAIDFDAIERVAAVGGAGEAWTPEKIMDSFFKKRILVFRGEFDGRKGDLPIFEIPSTVTAQIAEWFQILTNNINLLREITGFNEVSSGGADPRMATSVALIANDATTSGLSALLKGRASVVERVMETVVNDVIDIKKKGGDISGYIKGLGESVNQFVQLSDGAVDYEYGIDVEAAATEMKKQQLLDKMASYQDAQLIRAEDYFLIETTEDLKYAEAIIAHRMRKRQAEEHKRADELAKKNAEYNAMAAKEAEAAKQQTINTEKGWDYKIAELKATTDYKIAQLKMQMQMSEVGIKQQTDLAKKNMELDETVMKIDSQEYIKELETEQNAEPPTQE